MTPKLVKVRTAAPVLGLSVRRAQELAQAGTLPGLRKLGPKTFRVSVAELERFVGAPLAAELPPAA